MRVEPSGKNVTLLRITKDVTKYGIVDSRPVERGLRPEWIEKESNRKVERYRVTDSEKPLRDPGKAVRDGSVDVFRPRTGITEVVRERVKDVPPADRPAPRPKAIERLERERTQFDEQAKSQREKLIKEHERETAERRTGVSAQELRKQQEAELRAQREVEARERRAVEERDRRITKERDLRSKSEPGEKREESEGRRR